MKHLVIAQQQNTFKLPSNIAMEGIVDAIKEKVKFFKPTLDSNPDQMQEQLGMRDSAVEDIRKMLLGLKSDVSKGKINGTRALKIGPALSKLGIKAKTAKDAIKALSDEKKNLEKIISEAADISKESIGVIKSNDSKKQQEFLEKAKNFKDANLEKKNKAVKDNPDSYEFSKVEMIQMIDIYIGYCDTYLVARRKDLAENAEKADKEQKKVPAMEARKDGGIIESIGAIIVGIVKLVFYLAIFYILLMLSMAFALASPILYTLTAATVIVLWAFNNKEDQLKDGKYNN